MPGTLIAGPLMSPWVGVWDLVWHSPESWLVLASTLIGLTMAGVVLTVVGKGGRHAKAGASAKLAAGVVVVRTAPRPKARRRHRRRAA
ncbi:MAG: hypothetical protein IT305_27080 [Chloroflexi bacterium]|nr:hypothetical protein [Chloroflexota bacterium]